MAKMSCCRFLLVATLLISTSLLALASCVPSPSLHKAMKVEAALASNSSAVSNLKAEVKESSTVEESARQVPTGPNPIHHNRDPFHHFL